MLSLIALIPRSMCMLIPKILILDNCDQQRWRVKLTKVYEPQFFFAQLAEKSLRKTFTV